MGEATVPGMGWIAALNGSDGYSANTDCHGMQATGAAGSSASPTVGDPRVFSRQDAIVHDAATAKRHLSGIGRDANDDRPAKATADRPLVAFDGPTGDDDRIWVERRSIHPFFIGTTTLMLKSESVCRWVMSPWRAASRLCIISPRIFGRRRVRSEGHGRYHVIRLDLGIPHRPGGAGRHHATLHRPAAGPRSDIPASV